MGMNKQEKRERDEEKVRLVADALETFYRGADVPDVIADHRTRLASHVVAYLSNRNVFITIR